MQAPSQTPLLRPGVLDGQVIAVAGPAGGLGRAAAEACGALGAHVEQLGAEGHRVDLLDEPAVEAAIEAIAAAEHGLHTLVIDAAGMFAAAEPDAMEPLRAAADPAWVLARAAATRAMIPRGGGKVVTLAPAAGAGDFAHAARAALENLSRTLSIEWARHHVRLTTVTPGEGTAARDVALLVAFIASPAGDYYSGCRFSLGETQPAPS